MKDIKDIENMSIGALEAIADDKSADVPAGISDRILGIAAAAAFMEENSTAQDSGMSVIDAGRAFGFIPYISFAAAAACLMIFFTMPQEPEDTFDDPATAYAELERTFSYISSKMDNGIKIASAAEPAFEKTAGAFHATGKRN